MEKNYYLNPAFSIIYHNENDVEFRSGVWNVVSHVLNDDTQSGHLSRLIMAIDESGMCNHANLSLKTGVKIHEILGVINILKEKNILVPSLDKQIEVKNKIKIIHHDEMSELLMNLLEKQFSQDEIELIPESQLSFLEEAGEDIFRDALILEKVIEKTQVIFQDSIVISAGSSINPIFYLYLNKILHASEIPWFFSAVDGPFIYVGPLFAHKCCYECLESRIFMNMKNSLSYLQYKKSIVQKKIKMAKPTTNESILHLACSLTSLEISSYLTTGRSIATHKMLSIYIPTMEFSYQKILKLPGCRVCGIDNAIQGHQVHFDSGALLEL